MSDTESIQHQATEAVRKATEPLWKSKSLMVAALMMIAGLAIWIGRKPSSPPSGTGDAAFSSSSFAAAPGNSGSATPAATKQKSPALFRFGASYMVGFFGGWALRRSFKIAMLITGALLALIALLKGTGLIQLDWAGVESHISDSLAWLKGHSSGFRTFLTGYVPSAAAAAAGIFMGARRG